MAEESIRERQNKDIKELVKAIDFLFIPTSLGRHVRKLDKEGELTSRVVPYLIVVAFEVMRLGYYYEGIAKPIYNAIVNQ